LEKIAEKASGHSYDGGHTTSGVNPDARARASPEAKQRKRFANSPSLQMYKILFAVRLDIQKMVNDGAQKHDFFKLRRGALVGLWYRGPIPQFLAERRIGAGQAKRRAHLRMYNLRSRVGL